MLKLTYLQVLHWLVVIDSLHHSFDYDFFFVN